LFADIAQPNNARLRKQMAGKKLDAFFIGALLRKTRGLYLLSYHADDLKTNSKMFAD